MRRQTPQSREVTLGKPGGTQWELKVREKKSAFPKDIQGGEVQETNQQHIASSAEDSNAAIPNGEKKGTTPSTSL